MVDNRNHPPGTSKWNKVERRLFSFITKNWRGKPLYSHYVIVNLIFATTTRAGLEVRAQIDPNTTPKVAECRTSSYPRSISIPTTSTANGTIPFDPAYRPLPDRSGYLRANPNDRARTGVLRDVDLVAIDGHYWEIPQQRPRSRQSPRCVGLALARLE